MSNDVYPSRVNQIIVNGTDSLDWMRAMQMIDYLKKSRNHDQEILKQILKVALTGKRHEQVNALTFVDALFKNASSDFLDVLRKSPYIFGLSAEKIVRDPFLHRMLCNMVESWFPVIKKARAKNKKFIKWADQLFSYKHSYIMTAKTAKKFSIDFRLCHKLLIMFSQTMVNAKHLHSGSNDALLCEMLPSVDEAHRRLRELDGTLSDSYSISILQFLENFCEVCKQTYMNYAKNGTFDDEILYSLASRGLPKNVSRNNGNRREEKRVSSAPIGQNIQQMPNLNQQNNQIFYPHVEIPSYPHYPNCPHFPPSRNDNSPLANENEAINNNNNNNAQKHSQAKIPSYTPCASAGAGAADQNYPPLNNNLPQYPYIPTPSQIDQLSQKQREQPDQFLELAQYPSVKPKALPMPRPASMYDYAPSFSNNNNYNINSNNNTNNNNNSNSDSDTDSNSNSDSDGVIINDSPYESYPPYNEGNTPAAMQQAPIAGYPLPPPQVYEEPNDLYSTNPYHILNRQENNEQHLTRPLSQFIPPFMPPPPS